MATEAKAILRYIRVAPRKVRGVVNLVRGKNVADAFGILRYARQSAARVVEKVLKSAVANAENLEIGDVDELVVSYAVVDAGPTLKRFKARSMGRANPIKKRTSHVTIMVKPKTARPPKAEPAPVPAKTQESKPAAKPKRKPKAAAPDPVPAA